jgi:hypothetical protein
VTDDRDPFVSSSEVEPTILGPLAERDPNAPPDTSAEYVVTGAASFDDVLGRARRQGFLAGALAGGVAGAVVAAAIALGTSGPAPAASGTAAMVEIAEPEPAPALPAPAAIVPPRARAAASPPAASGGAGGRAPGGAESARADAATGSTDTDGTHGVEGGVPGTAPGPSGAHDDDAADGDPRGAARPAGDGTAAARPPDEREVTQRLAARRGELDACVEETPGERAASRGRRFGLVVVVEPTGQVSDARTDDEEIAATPLGVCLVQIARDTTFRPFAGEPARVEVRVRSDDAE